MSSNNQDSHNLKPREYKVVILGDGGVGKSGKEIKQKGTKVEKFIFPTTVDLSVLRVTIHYRLMNHVYVVKGI
jgi:hypothetical protein